MQDCERFEQYIEAFNEGELAEPEARLLQAHVDGCAHCREELRLAGEIHAAARTLPPLYRRREFRPPAAVPARGARAGFRLPGWLRPFAPAALGLAALLALWVLQRPSAPPIEAGSPLARELAEAAAEGGYSRRELEAALADLRLAMGYLQRYEVYTQALIAGEVGKNVMKFRPEAPGTDVPADPAG